MHSLLRSFYDLYTAGAVSEMKRSGIELKHSEKRTAGAVSERDLTFFGAMISELCTGMK